MTQIKKYNYSEKEISCIISDNTTKNYLWIGFKQDSDGICLLKKVSANNPLQVYYNIEEEVTEIKKGYLSGSYLYIAFDDATLIGKRYSITNPISTYVNISKPLAITESPVDILVDTYINFLIPGNESGTNTKIVRFTTAGVYYETIDLATVINASSFVKSGDDYWITTNTDPGSYVRVYFDSTWQYAINY